MKRFLKLLLVFGWLNFVCLENCPGDGPVGDNSLNVLFISVDDLRPELGCYGSEIVQSPNIDRMANRGMVFRAAYCQQSVCNPSRTSLMTGLRPDTIGVTGNHSHFRSKMPDVVTLPQHFKRNGYHAAAIGKIYHGVFPEGASKTKWDTMGDPESWSEPATRFGPRYYYTEEGIEAAKTTFQRVYKPKNPGPEDWTQKLVFGPATEAPLVSDNTLYDGKVADAAVKKLGQLKSRKEPFFLAVGFIKPHSPYVAPKKYFDLYNEIALPAIQSLPEGAPEFSGHGSGELRRYTDQPGRGSIPIRNQKRVRHAYYACVSYIDAQIGRVLDELERQGLSDTTIVCLFGDHGYHLGEQGLWGKTTNFELDTRVPLIIRVPGMRTEGQGTSSLVELVDIYPTLAELAGLPVGQHLEGKSFLSVLKNATTNIKHSALSQYPRGDGLMGYSMRTTTHRLTQWIHRETNEIRATELYEYKDGNIERNNVASSAQNVELLNDLREQFNIAFASSFSNKSTPALPKENIKVACVGDSITFGAGIRDRANNSYPALLQKMLGSNYEVENFGINGATLLKKGHKPYWQKTPYGESLKFNPDVVVINLGANDAVAKNWEFGDEFPADYKALIESYRSLPSNPKIFVCQVTPIFPKHRRYNECRANRVSMTEMIRQVAEEEQAELIDLHEPFANSAEQFPDGIHPNEEGALGMARHVFAALFGGQPPEVTITPPSEFNDENGAGFEKNNAGAFEELVTNVGTWGKSTGRVLVDNKHAKSGKQCLQIAGGKSSTVTMTIADGVNTEGQLEFWAERWTIRAPFTFRIEKQSGGTWTQIYRGDNQVRVGRSFLSHVKIPLDDPAIEKLRFSCSSPPNTGVLIDDLRITDLGKRRGDETHDGRPNILLIVSEDNGPELGCYGDKYAQTPNLDRLAGQGVRFQTAYVTQSVCSPSRGSILTGLYPHQNGQIGLATHSFAMFREWPTTYSILKQSGYRTGMLGKLHVNPESAIEKWIDYRGITSANFGKKNLGEYAKKSAEFFSAGTEPFFLTVNFPDAHWPVQNTVQGRPQTLLGKDDVKPMDYIGFDNDRIRGHIQGYYNCMSRLDECVGDLLSELEQSGKASNTLVIYIGDHGAQFARGKVFVTEAGLRIPYMIRWPGKVPKGIVSQQMVSTIDLLPTMVAAAGEDVPSHVPGLDLVKVLKSRTPVREYLFGERNSDAASLHYPQRSIRDSRYKLIKTLLPNRSDPAAEKYLVNGASNFRGSPTHDELKTADEATRTIYQDWLQPPAYQLFDLEKDPNEFVNLAYMKRFSGTKSRLIAELDKWQIETNDMLRHPKLLRKLTAEVDECLARKIRVPVNGWGYLRYLNSGIEIEDNDRHVVFRQREIPPGVPKEGHSANAEKYGYRIPSLLVTNSGTILAFTERRLGLHDHAQNDIVLKRSTDDGTTWSEEIVAVEDGMNSINDPLTVQLQSGRILLMFARFPYGRHARNSGWIKMAELGYDNPKTNVLTLICHSDDDGRTWSEPVDITRSVKAPHLLNANTPGAMIQISQGKHRGRIVTGLWGTLAIKKNNKVSREWQVVVAYSDDQGVTWSRTDPLTDNTGKGFPNECQVVEASNGNLVLLARNQGGEDFRKKSFSEDGGETWSEIEVDKDLPSVACMGAVVRGPPKSDGTWNLYASFPSNQGRKDGQIAVSNDNGRTWVIKKVITGPFAYSALRVSPNQENLLCFYESDDYKTTSFIKIPLTELSD